MQSVTALFCAGVLCLLLASCGGKESAAVASPATTTSTVSPPATKTAVVSDGTQSWVAVYQDIIDNFPAAYGKLDHYVLLDADGNGTPELWDVQGGHGCVAYMFDCSYPPDADTPIPEETTEDTYVLPCMGREFTASALYCNSENPQELAAYMYTFSSGDYESFYTIDYKTGVLSESVILSMVPVYENADSDNVQRYFEGEAPEFAQDGLTPKTADELTEDEYNAKTAAFYSAYAEVELFSDGQIDSLEDCWLYK
ncbi:MAG: hypothetical protein LBR73_03260 [Oscillospiraceae bacterium]|jgi:hypothetical protein|nr:hypothetical protein [Oscillospiraceae bacterium]